MIIKVKEPQPAEWPLMRRGQIVFTYFHFAADRKLTEAVLASGITAVAYETLRDDHGRLPLLTPMSEVAGRMSIQEGRQVSRTSADGPRHPAGRRAGRRAGQHHDPRRRRGRRQRGQGRRRLRRQHLPAGHQHGPAPLPRRHHAAERRRAVQRPAHDPRATSTGRPGDRRRAGAGRQGPAADRARRPEADEARQRDHRRGDRPRRLRRNQPARRRTAIRRSSSTTCVHYCVANMPGAVGRTSTFALCNVTLPWALQIANRGIERPPASCRRSPGPSTSWTAK